MPPLDSSGGFVLNALRDEAILAEPALSSSAMFLPDRIARSDAPEEAMEGCRTGRPTLKAWDEDHLGENDDGSEPIDCLTRPDDMTISGFSGNFGRLHRD